MGADAFAQSSSTRRSRTEFLRDVACLGALAAVIAVSSWLRTGRIETFYQDSSVVTLLVVSPWRAILWHLLATATGLTALHLLLAQRAKRQQVMLRPQQYLTPLALAGANVLAVPLLRAGASPLLAPWIYLTVDAHAFVVLTATALAALRLDAVLPGGLESLWPGWARPLSLRRWWRTGVLLTAVLLVSAWSPYMRYSTVVTGDEPKYLRYCESWWQGLGVDIEHVQDVSATGTPPRARFGAMLATLPDELDRDLRGLRRDARALLDPQNWNRRFNRGTDGGFGFLIGKRGGVFQVHNPGLSIVLLPAYVIDRSWFDQRTGRFPDALPGVNTAVLIIYCALVLAMAALTARTSLPVWLRATLTLALAVTIPLGSFAYQFYPETLGALIVCAVVAHVLESPAQFAWRRALVLGLGLGYLVWLHVRFLALGAVGFGWMVWTHRRTRGPLFVLLGCYATLSAAFCVYSYHITGSVWPTAIYTPLGLETQFAWSWVPRGLLAVPFDRYYGVFPTTPMFLLLLPGVGIMAARHAWKELALLGSLALVLVVPTAGHGLLLANTTPLRFVLPVLPLSSVPIAATLGAARRRPVVAIIAALLMLLSVRNGMAHDWQNDKSATKMFDSGASGWNPSLMFPSVDRETPLSQSPADLALLGFWASAALASVALGYRWARTPDSPDVWPLRLLPRTTIALMAVGVLGDAAILAGGPSRHPQFLIARPGFEAAQRAALAAQGAIVSLTQPVPTGVSAGDP